MPSFVARVLPVALFATGALTLVTTLVVSASLPHWYFGFSIPAFSFTGYDPPVCWWLFSLGLTATSVLCAILGVVMYRWVEEVRVTVRLSSHGRSNRAFCFLMVFAGFNLSTLAWTDHRHFYRHPGMLLPHIVTTLAAFASWLVSLRLNYAILLAASKLADAARLEPLAAGLRTSLRLKKRAFRVLLALLLVHVPFGYIVPWFPLCGDRGCAAGSDRCADQPDRCILFVECEAITGLSSEQCEFWRSTKNASRTELLNPAGDCAVCGSVNTLMALTQYMLIAALLALVALFHHDLSLEPRASEKEMSNGGLVGGSAHSP